MINAIPKHILVAGGIIVLFCLALYLADKNGYSRAVADYSVEAALLAEEAGKRQAIEQRSVNDLADQYYQAMQREGEKANEINDLKKQLRATRDRFSAYRLFNEAANSPDLPENRRTQKPDEEEDGLDAIQYPVTEYNATAAQVNALIEIIESSECFKPD